MGSITKSESTEKRIIDAAISVFTDKGFAGARMQEIADVAGINKALLHYYFRSKEQLFSTVFAGIAHDFATAVQLALQTDKPYIDKVRDLVAREIDLFSARPTIPLFILSEINRDSNHFKSMAKSSPIKQMFQAFIKETKIAVENGEIIEIDAIQLVLNIFALVRFPFIAKPMFQVVSGLSEKQFDAMMQQRKHDAAEFIIRSITPSQKL